MDKNYWLHRISYEWEASYSLLEKGYLSYGWHRFMKTNLYNDYLTDNSLFDDFMKKQNVHSKSRYSLRRFFNFQKGDIVVIPLFDSKFSIYEIIGEIVTADELPFDTLKLQTGNVINIDAEGIHRENDKDVFDIGYLYPVKEIRANIPRSYADAELISRMKVRQTNVNLNDLSENIVNAKNAQGPVNVYDKLNEATKEPIKKVLEQYVTDSDFEKIIKNFLLKKGADKVWIPAKNESGKEDGADADVIATFLDLNIVIYVQVKKHKGETSDWSVEQVSRYTDQKQDAEDDVTYIPWVVSTAEFSKDAISKAKEKGVRLIGGNELTRLLINSGISNLL